MLSCLMLSYLTLSSLMLSQLTLSHLMLSRHEVLQDAAIISNFFGITNTVPIIARGLTKINSGLTRLTGFLLEILFNFF